MIKTFFIGAICLSLSACSILKSDPIKEQQEKAQKDKIIETQWVTLSSGQKIEVRYVHNPDYNEQPNEVLYIIKPDHSTKETTTRVLGFAAQLLLTGSAQGDGFKKEDLTGSPTELRAIHQNYAFKQYIKQLEKDLVLDRKDNKVYSNAPIRFYPKKFRLIYDEYNGNTYSLKYQFTAIPTLNEQLAKKGEIFSSYYCFGTDNNKYTLEKWRENSYANVVEKAKSMVDQCFSGSYQRIWDEHLETLKMSFL
ncbi:hypothetical protein [Testudinibacter aquarius]|uniref:Lipoprotein n=1 Tax=Testudinibacter aquarius TaxID=1524974 RepID=A0A4R3Y1G0_9PAST|nr:hypothetical protein [Testudinibacter aquarius]TNG94985.1 hypothetical protein FHQ19_05640 [Pasteurellaceae bacterium UScroc12]TNG96402.1 hypothetical protein FHQ20_04950 [Pasteurellaceae bacterium USgator41]TNH00633.1 hypothetical protein FHQ28_07735 [Pasteurellaceae bacterium USgator11]TNH01198.1 hypothetical protein FHQ24_01720 [Pasteurellaceae bacterium UScroc31]KAE9525371.1 hypothetical protein A1D24_04835 [Testudinibacter aquarius]